MDRPIEQFDLLVLGSGEAGKYIAWTMASGGMRTALVERRYIGGSCPNIACLPSKNFIHSAKVARYASQAAAFGLPAGSGRIDMTAVRARKRKMVNELIEIHQARFAQSGVALMVGSGRFIAPRTMEVDLCDGITRTLQAPTVILSTGSRARREPIPGLAEAAPLTHIELLEIGEVPGHLLVLGGGYIGLEFAQAMRRLGSQVTIIERNERLLHREDEDVSTVLTQVFEREQIYVCTDVAVERISGCSGQAVTVHGTQAGVPLEINGTHLLIASGRTPNTDALGLERTGVMLTRDGYIQVDEHLRTTADGVFAVGDCARSPQFTHIAYDDFRIVRDTLAGKHRVSSGRQVPSCLFTDPELARVGLSESEARQKGIAYRLVRIPMNAVLRTRTTDETDGFLKALISVDNDSILGFTGVGANAGEMLAPAQLAMSAGLPYTSLRDLVITHPTFTEGLVYLFSAVPQSPIALGES